jgi:excisionase family DNA binding protein
LEAALSPYLTVPEVAALLRVSVRTVYRWIADETLPASRVKDAGSSGWRILESDALAMLEDAK